MFEGTGIDYSDEYVKTKDWYLNYVWTEDQQRDYIDWLADYLYKTSGARKELMNISSRGKKECKKAAEQFTMFFGWTTVERKKLN